MATSATPIKSARAYYELMTVEEAQCRGDARHDFPRPDPRLDRLPDGFRITEHDRHGNYYTEETCGNCGRIRYGTYRWDRKAKTFIVVARFRYDERDKADGRPARVRAPQGVLTPSIIKGMLMADSRHQWDRAVAELDAGEGEELDVTRAAPEPPQVKFSSRGA